MVVLALGELKRTNVVAVSKLVKQVAWFRRPVVLLGSSYEMFVTERLFLHGL